MLATEYLIQFIRENMKILSCSNAKNFVNNLTKFNKKDIYFTSISNFEDGETLVTLDRPTELQGEVVLVVQSLSNDVNNALIELLFTLEALNNSAPKTIYLLITYMGYSRQDKVDHLGESFSAKVVADLVSRNYIKRLFVIDLHASQTLGFFGIPSINLNPDEFIIDEIKNNYNLEDVVLISPDTGNVKSIIAISNKINVDYSIAIKYRPAANQNKILSMIGYDIKDKICIIIDDIIDSGGTLCNVAEKIAKQGAKNIIAYITHPVLSSKAMPRINESYLTKLMVSDSIDASYKINDSKKIEVFSLSDWCLEKIKEHTY